MAVPVNHGNSSAVGARFRRGLVVLPNLVTLGSLFCGFYAIVLTVGTPTAGQLERAAWAIFAGMLLDFVDGRIARLTQTQSNFGRQLDSLADLISFGIAPAILLYAGPLEDWGFAGLIVAFFFTAGGAIRLARYNVATTAPIRGGELPAETNRRAPATSIGLPIPPAAGTLVGVVLSIDSISSSATGVAAAAAIVLALLMVCEVRYRTFKELRATSTAVLLMIFFFMTLFVVVAFLISFAAAMTAFFGLYAVSGPVEQVFAGGSDAKPIPSPSATDAAAPTAHGERRVSS